jgi:hypothetical protein
MTLPDFLTPPAPGMADALVAPCWLLVNGLLAAAGWRWARTLFPRDPLVETVAHTVVLCWGCVVALAFALSLVGWLSGLLLLGGVGGAAVIALIGRRFLPAPGAPAPGPLVSDKGEMTRLCCWGLLLAFWLVHVVIDGLLAFPRDYDSLTYHIPLIDQWLHAHSLYAPDCGHWSTPGNNEVLGLWLVGPFTGDFLIHLNNLPATLLLAASTVSFGSRLGLTRPLACLGGLAVVCNFIVLRQLTDAENDVAAAACFVAAVLYAFRYADGGRRADLLLAGVSLGLLAGVKFYALGYAVLAGACLVFLAASAHGARAAGTALLAGVAGGLAFGGYWYVRNLAAVGSPIYPRELFTRPDILSRIYPEVADTSFAGNRSPELFGLFVEAVWKMTGPCQLAGFLLSPLTLLWLAGSGLWPRSRKAGAGKRRGRVALALLLAGTCVLLAVTPFAVEDSPGTLNQMRWHYCPVRYGLCFLSVATVAALVLLQDGLVVAQALCPGLRLLALAAEVAVGAVILYQFMRTSWRISPQWVDRFLIAGNLVLGVALLVLLAAFRRGVRRWLAVTLGAAALPAVAWGCQLLAERWHGGFVNHYDRLLDGAGVAALATREPEAGKVCSLYDRCYPFFGSRRQYRVCQPDYVFSPEWLADYLREHRVVAVWTSVRPVARGRFRWFDELRARRPRAFTQLNDTMEVSVFAVETRE